MICNGNRNNDDDKNKKKEIIWYDAYNNICNINFFLLV